MGLPERLAVQRELNAELPQAGAALVQAVQAQIPTYQTLAPAQLVEVQAIAVWALGRAVALWVHDGALDAHDLARFRGIGAARAADGRPLPAVLRAYRVTASLASDLVVERGRGRLDVADVLALTRVWWASIDELSEALFTGYTLAAERLAGDRQRALRDLFDDLLVGRQTSPGALSDRCRQLGVTLPAVPCLLVIEPIDPALVVTEAATAGLVAELGLDGSRPASRRGGLRRRRTGRHAHRRATATCRSGTWSRPAAGGRRCCSHRRSGPVSAPRSRPVAGVAA